MKGGKKWKPQGCNNSDHIRDNTQYTAASDRKGKRIQGAKIRSDLSNSTQLSTDEHIDKSPVKNSNTKQRGLVIFQRDWVTNKQLQDISNHYKQKKPEAAPKILFEDNNVDKKRDNDAKRRYKAGIFGEYDRSIAFGITTKFHGSHRPHFNTFKQRINHEFTKLKQHLLNGGDIIIPLPKSKDIQNRGRNRFFHKHQRSKQVIYHRVGIIANLPFSFIKYIQQKIDELVRFSFRTQVVQCYNYKKENYKTVANSKRINLIEKLENEKESLRIKIEEEEKEKLKKEQECKELEKKLGDRFIWQWQNGNGEWLSFDEELSKNIEDTEINGGFEIQFNDTMQSDYMFSRSAENEGILESKWYDKNGPLKVKRIDLIEKLENEKESLRIKMEEEEKEKLKKEQECKKLKKKMNASASWQWQDADGSWKCYDEDVGEVIEALKIGGGHTFKYYGNGQKYNIIKHGEKKGVQINIQTYVQRNVRRMTQVTTIKYPSFWDMMHISDKNYAKPQLIDLEKKGLQQDLQKICDAFFKSVNKKQYKVTKIHGLQNQMLYDKWWNERKSVIKLIGEKRLNEQDLFHGTKSEDVMKVIGTEGFRKEFNKTAAYGKGTYFARDASYSINYAAKSQDGVYSMFLCRVICGESCIGKTEYELTNWPKKDNGLIYDSLVNSGSNQSVFVIHENVRAYPMFVIYFRKRNDISNNYVYQYSANRYNTITYNKNTNGFVTKKTGTNNGCVIQ